MSIIILYKSTCKSDSLTSTALQAFKDSMHAYDHGVAITILSAIIRCLQEFAVKINCPKNLLVDNLSLRFQSLCSSLEVKHITLMSFVNQSIVDYVDTFLDAAKTKHQPLVDASDVQRLMLCVPFILDGLITQELDSFNSTRSLADRVSDPMPEVIMAVNEWLHWYQLYRQSENGAYLLVYDHFCLYWYIKLRIIACM